MLKDGGISDDCLEPPSKVSIRFLVANVPRGSNTPQSRELLKSNILSHYYGQHGRAKSSWLNVFRVVSTNAILIVFSQELVDRINADPVIFHASGSYRAHIYAPINFCDVCCAIGQHECSGGPICGDCAGNHLTSACTEPLIRKCANCSGDEQFSMFSNHCIRFPFCPKVLAAISRS